MKTNKTSGMRNRVRHSRLRTDQIKQNSPVVETIYSSIDPKEEYVTDPGAQQEQCTAELNGLHTLNSNFDELSQFDLFKTSTSVLECKVDGLDELLGWTRRLEHLTRYMLGIKHTESTSKKVKRRKIRDAEGELLYPKESMALKRYLGFVKKVKNVQANHLDIIKIYKSFEQTVLSNSPIVDGETINLGPYTQLCLELTNSLSKLLLSVRSLDPEKRKGALTYLFSSIIIYRQFKVKTKPCVDTLTAPYSGTPISELTDTFNVEKMKDWVSTTGSEETLTEKLALKIYAGNASSPNSGCSAKNIGEDLRALRGRCYLMENIKFLAEHFDNSDEFNFYLLVMTVKIPEIRGPATPSRLFHFTAPGGKSRIIANVDGVSQTALSGLHFGFYKLLSELPQDHTFNHRAGLDYVYKGQGNYYSVDLSAATDRMPRKIQQMLIQSMFEVRKDKGCKYQSTMASLSPENLAKAWEAVVDRTYSTANSQINNGQPVFYAVGQGMGLFTSGSIMSLVHHYIVNCICGISKENYSLVGDDLVIRGEREDFDRYLAAMTSLGIEVNLSKTVLSESNLPTVEFARNYIIMGSRIVPLQYGALFAGKQEKTALETFVFQSNWGADTELIGRFLVAFKRVMTFKKIACMLYYYGKNNIQDQIDLNGISRFYALPGGLTEINFGRIRDICVVPEISEEQKRRNYWMKAIPKSSALVANLMSQLVVRNSSEIAELDKLLPKLMALTDVDNEIKEISLALHERLSKAEIIEYDCDYLGNPLITRSERKLINELMDKLYPGKPVRGRPKGRRRF